MYSETTNYQKNQRKDRNLKLARDLSSGAEFEIAEIFKYFMSSFLPLVKIFFLIISDMKRDKSTHISAMFVSQVEMNAISQANKND